MIVENSLLVEDHRGEVPVIVGAAVVVGYVGGLLVDGSVAIDLLRFEITSTFLLRAARRARMLATTAL